MLIPWLELLEKNCQMVIALRTLAEKLSDRGDSAADELAKEIMEQVASPFNHVKVPSNLTLTDLQTNFKTLRTIVGSNQATSAPQSNCMWLDEAIRLELEKHNVGCNAFLPQYPLPSPSAFLKLVQVQDQAFSAWEQWRNNFGNRSHNQDSIESVIAIQTSLEEITRKDFKVPSSPDVELLIQGLRSIFQLFLQTTQDLRKRLEDHGLSTLGSTIHREVQEVNQKFEQYFPYRKVLVDLKSKWEKHTPDAKDLLCRNWDQQIRDSRIYETFDKALPIALGLIVCEFFDKLPGAQQLSPAKELIAPLDSCLRELGSLGQVHIQAALSLSDTHTITPLSSTISEETRQQTGLIVNGEVIREAIIFKPTSAMRLVRKLREAKQGSEGEDKTLADACEELAEKLQGRESLESWLTENLGVEIGSQGPSTNGDVAKRSTEVWKLAHLALTAKQSLRVIVLKALEVDGGVRFEETQPTVTGDVPPCWMVRRLKEAYKHTDRSRTRIWLPGLETPLPPPAIAVVGEDEWSDSFSSIWQPIQSQLIELKRIAASDNLWNELDRGFLEGFYQKPGKIDSKVAVNVCNALNKFILLHHDQQPHRNIAQDALRLIYNKFRDQGIELLPRMNSKFEPETASAQPTDRVKIFWMRSEESVGNVLKVIEYGNDSKPAHVVASGGDSLAKLVNEYFQIEEIETTNPIDKTLQEKRTALSIANRDASMLEKVIQEDLRKTVRLFDNRKNQLLLFAWIKSIINDENPQRRVQQDWYRLLRTHANLSVFPEPDLKTGSVRATVAMIKDGSKLEWCFNDDIPFGHAIDKESLQFSVSAREASGKFSYGPRDQASLFDELKQQLAPFESLLPGTDGDELKIKLRKLAIAFRDRELMRRISSVQIDFPSTDNVLIEALDALSTAQIAGEVKDLILSSLRWFAGRDQRVIEPGDWSFQSPGSHSGHAIIYDFDPQARENLKESEKWVISFGLRSNDSESRRAQVKRLVGPAPTGWSELRELTKKLPDSVKAVFNSHIDEWPAAYEKRDLIRHIVDLHTKWYDDFSDRVGRKQPDLDREISRALERVVTGQELSLFLKSPNDEFPQSRAQAIEEEPIFGSQSKEALVKRPGIKDASNSVCCKAKLLIPTSS